MEQEKTLVRAQVLMTREQRRRIERLAEQEGRSLSDITRRALDAGLDHLEGETDEALQETLDALAILRAIREEIHLTYGVMDADLLAQVREDRERELDELWKQE